MAASALPAVQLANGKEPIHVLPEVFEMKEEMISNRRWFHMFPEVAFKEVNTAAHVVELLRSYGIEEIYEKIGITGVVAMIHGAEPGPCIALRADMDALPVTETADIEFKSRNVGVMHACGHDGHMTGLLAAAKILFAERASLKGSVKLIFQPAEEGLGGAREMIKDGVLEGDRGCGPRVDAVYGCHLWTMDQCGAVCCSHGPVMAASDRFDIEVRGRGGHGSAPHATIDAIVEAAHLVTSLQTIVSRNTDPLEAGVVTCSTIQGGYAYNVICDKVTITGTARSFTPQVQDLIETRMQKICCGVASTFGGEIDLTYKRGYPPTVNAYPECVKLVQEVAQPFVGLERSQFPQKTMGAEDFSYFLQLRPGCFWFVGAALPGDVRPHHKSVFDFDECALLLSASLLVGVARRLLLLPPRP